MDLYSSIKKKNSNEKVSKFFVDELRPFLNKFSAKKKRPAASQAAPQAAPQAVIVEVTTTITKFIPQI